MLAENKTMNHYNNLYIVSKITPVYPSGEIAEEYIVSEDFFVSLLFWDFGNHIDGSVTSNKVFLENSYYFLTDRVFLKSLKETQSFCHCINNLAFVKFKIKVKITIDAILFSLIMLELKESKTFRKNMLSNIFGRFISAKKLNFPSVICKLCGRSPLPIHSLVHLNITEKNVLDYKWGQKVQVLVNEKRELENAMAWLSTLGGAFSALGDTYIHCAERAGAISFQQLYIALRLGDPLTICRCKIYLAMSLLQRGYYKKTKLMIRELYKFSTGVEGSKDFRLRNMCLAVWNRLRYLLSLRSSKKLKA